MIGVMSGIWCFLNGTGNFIGGVIVDKVGRTRQLCKSTRSQPS